MTATAKQHFDPAFFDFFRELAANNDRDWFQANKHRYEDHVKEPSLRFISDFGPRLRTISPHFDAIPKAVGGSLFRIYRDVRFSKDKRPYKTAAGIQFRHKQAKNAHCPGFYLHLSPEEIFVGLGIWHPDRDALAQIRDHLVDDPDGWRAVTGDAAFASRFTLGGESLKRPPRGYDPDHPLVEDLKRKDFIVSTELSPDDVMATDFLDAFTDHCRSGTGFVRYLCQALDVPF